MAGGDWIGKLRRREVLGLCPVCGGARWWQCRAGGLPRCAICHPDPHPTGATVLLKPAQALAIRAGIELTAVERGVDSRPARRLPARGSGGQR
jgi:hypothetical protein